MGRVNRAVYKMAPGEAPPRRGRGDRKASPDVLTARELDVMKLIVNGYTRDEIASQLTLSLSTVSMHMNNIYSKLGVHTHQQATAEALRLGLVTL